MTAQSAPTTWTGSWIWCAPDGEADETAAYEMAIPVEAAAQGGVEPDRWAMLRRTFQMGATRPPSSVRVAADGRYALFVNGSEVGRGPIRTQWRRQRYDEVDITTHLRSGANVVAVLARWYGQPVAFTMRGRPVGPVGRGCVAVDLRLGDDVIGSDDSWRGRRGRAWTATRRDKLCPYSFEMLDAAALPSGWCDVGFDDTAWAPAVVLAPIHLGHHGRSRPPTEPFGMLQPRPIALLTGETRTPTTLVGYDAAGTPEETTAPDPVSQVERDGRVVDGAGDAVQLPLTVPAGAVVVCDVDFGDVVAGHLDLAIEAGTGGRIDLAVSEAIGPDGRIDLANQRCGIRYTTSGAPAERYVSFDPLGFRFARVAIRPGPSPLTLHEVAVRERLHPTRLTGPFTCSDPRLERIWAIGRHTVDLCSHDAYIDCPTREQRAWTGDAVVHQLVDLTTNEEWGLARWHPELTASARDDGMLAMSVAGDIQELDIETIPDWALHWVRSVHNLYRYTGDRELVASLMPTAEGVLRWFAPYQTDDGLLADVSGWVLIDWSSIHLAGRSSALNALWGRALSDFEEMATWLGDAGRAAWARARWQRLRDGFERFWDGDRSVYVDQILDGSRTKPVSQHGGAAAIAAGLVPDGRIATVIDTITDPARVVRRSWTHDPAEWPPGGQHFETLRTVMPPPTWDVEREIVAAQPFFRYVVHEAMALAGRADRLPGALLDWDGFEHPGESTWPETWFGGTHCHGWSATPTHDLVAHTLGIRPHRPGFEAALIAPRLGPLDWAEGSAPTPHGAITVHVERSHLRLETPVAAHVDVGGRSWDVAAGRHDLRFD